MTTFVDYYESPIGKLTLLASEKGLTAIYFENHKLPTSIPENLINNPVTFEKVCDQLDEYFSGGRKAFDIELDMGGTAFQKKVWQELTDIPYGETISYQELAIRVGNPKASRAVGAANGKNPLSIIIPCHRVIAKNGKLTGYAGGVQAKKWLLEFEAP
ncbi:cysteine methyltransferase [Veronia nyctiphanis]|uniref:Methylated-DNA--protein-cysteine methyltransferase n=1 Tax=Veronia nyctiphanis TaxID=1278244 RepID=A0A4Q0YUV7_9GAMM|nr:methylated-DNA--[protein]-cysteine S-methyltransferase [Veronia nyctiphanis]RXJ74615.1 cysteine methyltransferase [Veronia nyctiphanis]